MDFITAMKHASNGEAVARVGWPDPAWRVVRIPSTLRLFLILKDISSQGINGEFVPGDLDMRPYSPTLDSLAAEDWHIVGK